MASIVRTSNGITRILFYDLKKDRQSVHLGKCSKDNAGKIKSRIESMLECRILGLPIRQDDAVWLAKVGADVREQLEKVGLVDRVEPLDLELSEPALTLSEFLTQFQQRNGASKKPATRIVWKQVIDSLNKELPKGILLRDVTAGHAKAYLSKLEARIAKGELSSSTVHKRCGFARQFFQDAIDWELIDKNPFARVKTKGTSKKTNVEVPRETIQLVLEKCDPTWKAIVGLSRYGGIRCPSETLSLTWGDIDWENSRMSIPECKVEHIEGRGIRSCPLFPELRSILEELFEASTKEGKYPSPESYVIDKPAYRKAANTDRGWANANLRTQFLKILRRAGVAPWNRLFHSMRASRQTELEREFPLHVVCSWLGNTEAVARKSYLLVTDEDFAKAIEPKRGTNGAPLEPKRGTNGALQTSAAKSNKTKKAQGNTGKTYVFLRIPELSRWRRRELNPLTSKQHPPSEFAGDSTTTKKRNSKRGTHGARASELPKDEASSIALSELVALWPTLTIASQNRIYELAQSEAARFTLDASSKRGAQ
jgi:integrase